MIRILLNFAPKFKTIATNLFNIFNFRLILVGDKNAYAVRGMYAG
jgi:hypothetical protein